MKYRFWDMDHTICDNDCDVSWKEFLFATGRAPADDRKLVDHYFDLYNQNALPFDEFMEFQLKEFVGKTPAEMAPLCQEHFDTMALPKIYPQAEAMIREQLAAGDCVCLLTATNSAIAAPLAAYLGVAEMIATQLELKDGVYTGGMSGVYCGGTGKVTDLDAYCRPLKIDPGEVWYYGDSTSDQYVLGHVGHPVATNPSDVLRAMAEKKGWEILDFKS